MMLQEPEKDATADVAVPLVMMMLTMMKQTVMMMAMPMSEMEEMTIMIKSREIKKISIETKM